MGIEKFMDVAQCVYNITNYYSGHGNVTFIIATYNFIVKTKRTKTLIKNMADLIFFLIKPKLSIKIKKFIN